MRTSTSTTAVLSTMTRLVCFVVIFLSVFLGLFQEQVFAHAFAYYASTPVTPPVEFLWWWPASLMLLIGGVYFPLRMSLKWSRLYSLVFALFWVVVFSIIFFLTGSFVAALHTGSPPGLGFPCSTYWGRTFSQVGGIFLFWNVFGLLLLMVVPVQFLFESGKSIEKTKRLAYWSWVITIPIGFVLAVMPYVVQGAWVHGWGGGYVTMQCQSQIEKLHYAIVMYALDHDNHLPVAQNFAELYPQIESYLPESMRRSGWRGKYDVCVIGRAWDQTPKPFVWNSEFSGKEVFRNDDWQPYHSEIGNPIVSVEGGTVYVCGKPWVNCPYIHQDMVRPSGDIRNTEPEKLERLRHHRNLAQ